MKPLATCYCQHWLHTHTHTHTHKEVVPMVAKREAVLPNSINQALWPYFARLLIHDHSKRPVYHIVLILLHYLMFLIAHDRGMLPVIVATLVTGPRSNCDCGGAYKSHCFVFINIYGIGTIRTMLHANSIGAGKCVMFIITLLSHYTNLHRETTLLWGNQCCFFQST